MVGIFEGVDVILNDMMKSSASTISMTVQGLSASLGTILFFACTTVGIGLGIIYVAYYIKKHRRNATEKLDLAEQPQVTIPT